MKKYKVLDADVDPLGNCDVPEKAQVISIITKVTPPAIATPGSQVKQTFSLVCVMPYDDWVVEFPEDAAKEVLILKKG